MKVKEIPFAPGYCVSTDGHVYSESYNGTGVFKQMKEDIGEKGYHRVTIRINKKRSRFLVHRLVAATYIPNPKNLPIVNHEDSDRGNNHVRNLRWSTQSKNILHGIEKGNIIPTQGERHGNHLLTEQQVIEIRDIYSRGNISQEKLALPYGVKRGAIKDIVERKTWKHVL